MVLVISNNIRQYSIGLDCFEYIVEYHTIRFRSE